MPMMPIPEVLNRNVLMRSPHVMRPQASGVSSQVRSRVMVVQGTETRPRQIHFASRHTTRVLVMTRVAGLIPQPAACMMMVRQERVAQAGSGHRRAMLPQSIGLDVTPQIMTAGVKSVRVKRMRRRSGPGVARMMLQELRAVMGGCPAR